VSRFLEKQSPGRAGDCFASLAMTVSRNDSFCPREERFGATKNLSEGDAVSRFLEKQSPGRAGDCFAFGSQ
jgi:hypothetical protein